MISSTWCLPPWDQAVSHECSREIWHVPVHVLTSCGGADAKVVSALIQAALELYSLYLSKGSPILTKHALQIAPTQTWEDSRQLLKQHEPVLVLNLEIYKQCPVVLCRPDAIF